MKQGVKGVQESGLKIGYTIGENTSGKFQFVISDDSNIKKWEYVYLKIHDETVIGRIEEIVSKSELLNENMDFQSIDRYSTNGLNDFVNICISTILGKIKNGFLMQSREIVKPGMPVYPAGDEILQQVFSFREEESLDIGSLPDNNVKVSLNVNGLRRHLAILAQTGAGKSHTASVIMEELLKKGASIIVLDPHADYVFFKCFSYHFFQCFYIFVHKIFIAFNG